MKTASIRCVVAAVNSQGESDFFFVIVETTVNQIRMGQHYDAAINAAKNAGYTPYLAYDEADSGFRFFLLADWLDCQTVKISSENS